MCFFAAGNITFELGLSDTNERTYGYAIPQNILSATTNERFVRIPWSDFIQPSWWGGTKISGEEAAKKLVALKFYMGGQEGTYNFLITKIGSLDMPINPASPTGCIPPAVATDGNAGWYTISGVQLRNQPTVRGVYIHPGQKVVIK